MLSSSNEAFSSFYHELATLLIPSWVLRLRKSHDPTDQQLLKSRISCAKRPDAVYSKALSGKISNRSCCSEALKWPPLLVDMPCLLF